MIDVTTLEISWQMLMGLAGVAIIAGFVDAMAGGGGLLTIPAMLMANIPPLLTLGTNKLQATAGSFSASITMIKNGKVHPKQIWQAIIMAFIGSLIGAGLVQLLPPEMFKKIIPLLMAVIGFYYLFAPSLGQVKSEPRISVNKWRYGVVPAIGIYDGYLGPGTGMFLALGGIVLRGWDMVTSTANAKVINFTTNLASLLLFVFAGQVWWKVGIVMMIGQTIGAFFGAKMAIKGGSKLIRPVVVVVCFAMLTKYVLFS